MDFVAVDLELANAKWASACQISLVKVENSQIIDVWESYVKPAEQFRELGPIQFGKHKISQDKYMSAPTLQDLWPQIQSFVGTNSLVAHNAAFDIGVLSQSLDSWGISDALPKAVCSQILASTLLSDQKLTLKILTEQFGIELKNHHDAKSDAIACAELTLALSEKAGIYDVESLLEIAQYRKGFGRSRATQSPRMHELNAINEKRNNELIHFFKTGPNQIEFVELPFAELNVSVIRSVFTLENDEIANWIQALGGNFVNHEIEGWGDLTLEGNYPSASPEVKIREIKQLAALKSAKSPILNSEKFYELIFEVMAALE